MIEEKTVHATLNLLSDGVEMGKKGDLGPNNDVLTTCNAINSASGSLTVWQQAIFFRKMEARATTTAIPWIYVYKGIRTMFAENLNAWFKSEKFVIVA